MSRFDGVLDRDRLRRILLFVFAGGVGFVVDAAVLMAVRPEMGDIWAQILAYGVATMVTFTVNLWTFQVPSISLTRHGTRYALSSGVSALVVNGLYVTGVLVGLFPLVALSVGAGISALVSYLLMARWVFRDAIAGGRP